MNKKNKIAMNKNQGSKSTKHETAIPSVTHWQAFPTVGQRAYSVVLDHITPAMLILGSDIETYSVVSQQGAWTSQELKMKLPIELRLNMMEWLIDNAASAVLEFLNDVTDNPEVKLLANLRFSGVYNIHELIRDLKEGGNDILDELKDDHLKDLQQLAKQHVELLKEAGFNMQTLDGRYIRR